MGENKIKNEEMMKKWFCKLILNKYGFYSADQEGFIEMWHVFS